MTRLSGGGCPSKQADYKLDKGSIVNWRGCMLSLPGGPTWLPLQLNKPGHRVDSHEYYGRAAGLQDSAFSAFCADRSQHQQRSGKPVACCYGLLSSNHGHT